MWKHIDIDEIASTNDEVQKYPFNTVITAQRQTNGRGRRGRSWESMDGNLFMSFLLDVELKDLGRINLVTSLSIAEALSFIPPLNFKGGVGGDYHLSRASKAQSMKDEGSNPSILLKWPNDVLLNNKKVSGILLESGKNGGLVVGVGVNIVDSPKIEGLIYPATSLKEEGIIANRMEFLKKFLTVFEKNLHKDFVEIKDKWLKLAKGLGEEIIIKDENSEKRGIFKGLDDNGCLLLETKQGIERILVGDIFYGNV